MWNQRLVDTDRGTFEVFVRCSMEIHQYVAHSQLVIFEAGNHYPFLKKVAEFTVQVKAFLTSRLAD